MALLFETHNSQIQGEHQRQVWLGLPASLIGKIWKKQVFFESGARKIIENNGDVISGKLNFFPPPMMLQIRR